MATDIKLPQFGMGMSEAQVVRWYKNCGEPIVKGEPLLEVEAAKTVNEIPAPANGVLSSIVAQVGDVVPVYGLLGVIGGADVPTHVAAPPTASPRARRLAQEHKVDLSAIVGTGPGGRVTDEDVQRTLTLRGATASPTGDAADSAIELTGMRGEIARRMLLSLQGSAQLTLTRTVDVTALAALRASPAPAATVGYNALIVRAVALALRRHPALNATCDGRSIRRHPHIHIGIAVALEEGLIVPVVRDADRLSPEQLSVEIRRLTQLARGKQLAPADIAGGTFSVSNLGAFDIDAFTPIINPPQAAVLGIGRITEHYARSGDHGQWRQVMVVSLTIDHRVIDGAPGAQFLRTLAELIAAPEELTADGTANPPNDKPATDIRGIS